MITEEELRLWLINNPCQYDEYASAEQLEKWQLDHAHALLLFLDSKGVRVLVDEMDEHGLAHIGYERLPGVE
jgi:hypothetical protein